MNSYMDQTETKEVTPLTIQRIEEYIAIIREMKSGSVYEIASKYCKLKDINILDQNGRKTSEWYDIYRNTSHILRKANMLGILEKHGITATTGVGSAPIAKRIYEFKGDTNGKKQASKA